MPLQKLELPVTIQVKGAKTMSDSPLERLKNAGFTQSPISYERVTRLQEELDQHVKELGELMGNEWVVLTAYLLGEGASSRGLAADLLAEVAMEVNVPPVKAPGARAQLRTAAIPLPSLKTSKRSAEAEEDTGPPSRHVRKKKRSRRA